ncbi:hypothetical protein LVB87_00760 [Lysobacter sp. KIS68-7]|uniref:hypothetical protein n=1 Tax=Lysobacter sp. KIS68-7 TaxID=2904252 RepID=UPI001E4B0CF6|nr:hypothetical protein [Lysobacter sp. KIS68-7]UHQ19734.1 hypothetical protein LVB87_00760 [Lysobacter sp. KIS68-7]
MSAVLERNLKTLVISQKVNCKHPCLLGGWSINETGGVEADRLSLTNKLAREVLPADEASKEWHGELRPKRSKKQRLLSARSGQLAT